MKKVKSEFIEKVITPEV